MIQSLKDIFNKISKLPNDLQEQLALEISKFLSDLEWDKLLNHPKSEKLLEEMKEETIGDIRGGETVDVDEVFENHGQQKSS